jgi:hypothetical protein
MMIAKQELCGHLREPPPPGREGDADVRPGDDAVDHHGERESEHCQDHLVRAGERDLAGVALGAEALFVLGLQVEDE